MAEQAATGPADPARFRARRDSRTRADGLRCWRSRAAAPPGANLRTGDIESLPYGEASFDVVTAFNAIQYATDPAAAVAELARVCRPGGQVAVMAWGDPAHCETEALFARLRSLAPPPPGTPAPLAVSEPASSKACSARPG